MKIRMKPALTASAIAALGLIGIGAAYSGQNDHDDHADIQALLTSSMSLSQAVASAEAKTGGTAMEAKWDEDDHSGARGFEIELVGLDGSVSKVMVVASGDGPMVTAIADDDHDDDDGEYGHKSDKDD